MSVKVSSQRPHRGCVVIDGLEKIHVDVLGTYDPTCGARNPHGVIPQSGRITQQAALATGAERE
jgi:hypothetical protein